MAYSYTHTQDASANVWSINHNLGTNAPIVSVNVNVDSTLTKILPKDIRVIDSDNIEIEFSIPYTGVARII